MMNQQPNFKVAIEEPPAPEPRSYLIVKELGVARPFRVLDGVTREQLFAPFVSEDEARARIAEHAKDHEPKPIRPSGTIDDMGEAALLERESASMQDFWQQKRVTLDRLEKHESKPKSEPEPQPKDPAMPVSVQEVADLEAKLKELQAERDQAKASQTTKAEPAKPPEGAGDVLDAIEEAVETDRQLATLSERVGRLQELTENIGRLAEVLS